MTEYVNKGNLKVSKSLDNLISEKVCHSIEVSPESFWSNFEEILNEFSPKNKALLEKRENLQEQIDNWHISNKENDFDKETYKNFLKEIGYLLEEGEDFSIETDNVDPEISTIAGPQLVVPVMNARFALNAANARWGSLYDALYGTDVISEENGAERGGSYNSVRGEKIDYCLVGEPSSSIKVGDTIRIGRRGSLSGKLKLMGKQGHIAYPEKIINPIFLVSNIISELKEKKWDKGNDHFQPTSFQISNINSGTGAGNIVPGELVMDFNFRFCSESTSEGLIEEFEKILSSHNVDYKVEWNLSGLPFLTTKTYFVDLVIDSIKKVLGREPVINNGGGTSDGRFMSVMDAEIVELGPLNESIHKIDENVSLKDLEELSKIFLEILNKISTSSS